MQTPHLVKGLRKQARGIWRSNSRRLALCACVLLLLGSLGIAGAVLHNRQLADIDVESEEIDMEVDARGEWQRPPPPPPPPPPPSPARKQPDAVATTDQEPQVTPVGPPRQVNAAWYDVPDDSLAKRRAGEEELTAAHNRLPIGTLVRVTHLSNGKSVLVRITDRGIRDKKIKLDVCREAAAELGMVRKGIARVKMEIVREESGSSMPDSRAMAAQP